MEDRNRSQRDGQITHTSVETEDGRRGFTPGEDLSDREEFAGRPNVTEEREQRAIDPHEDAGERR